MGEEGLLAARTPPSGNRDLLLAPSQAPFSLPILSCRSSIQGPGLTACADGNGQSSTSPARPVRDLVLCVPSTLHACIVLIRHIPAHTQGCASFFPLPAEDTGPSFCDSPGLCHGPLSPGGAAVKSRGSAPPRTEQGAASPRGLFLCISRVCCPPCGGCSEKVQKCSSQSLCSLGLSVSQEK